MSVRVGDYDRGMRSKYTRAYLAPFVESSTSFTEVMQKLGLRPTGGNHRHISGRIRAVGLDVSHFGSRLRERVDAISEEKLREAVRESLSMAQVLSRFDLPPDGRAHHELKRRLGVLEIDTSHIRGAGWSRGETIETHRGLAEGVRKRSFTDDEVFVANSEVSGSYSTWTIGTESTTTTGWRISGCYARTATRKLTRTATGHGRRERRNVTPTLRTRAIRRSRERAVIGSRCGFRCRWTQVRGGSSPPARTTRCRRGWKTRDQ